MIPTTSKLDIWCAVFHPPVELYFSNLLTAQQYIHHHFGTVWIHNPVNESHCILRIRNEGNMEFAKINMETYTQQHFGMFSGEKKRVSLRFTSNLLDTMVDRFGTGADVSYYADGDRYFVVNAEIAISDQFFGWLCGFRKMAKIVSPPSVVEDFQNFLDDIYGRYDVD